MNLEFKGIISTDWSECLSPNGPFDPISFCFPELKEELKKIFFKYTSNQIDLSNAIRRIEALIPHKITEEMMDEYLKSEFKTYRNVPQFIEWCMENNILFMINSTGSKGYFQFVLENYLIPPVPIVSCNPFIDFSSKNFQDTIWLDIKEIHDKPTNTQTILKRFGLSPKDLIIMGDSGGDGPHFEWGWKAGAHLISIMKKGSLERYCKERNIELDVEFGIDYSSGEAPSLEREMEIDFMDLRDHIRSLLSI